MIIPIADPADLRLEAYRDVRERDLVGRRGGFIAEGEVVLRVLIGAGRHRTRSVLLAEKRLAALEPLLAGLPHDTPVYVAPQPVLDAIAGFHLHRGILAHGERSGEADADVLLASLPSRALVVALFGVGNHDNVGGVFRNAAAFGADAVLLDEACCDPLYRKAIRVSVGAALSLPFTRLPGGLDPLAMFARHGFEALALSPAGAETLTDVRRAGRTVLMLGAEGPGLSDEMLARARAVRIPMAGKLDSLNVATASGIALHYLAFAG